MRHATCSRHRDTFLEVPMRRPSVFLVDGSGQPFSPRIENAVLTWLSRLRSVFPSLDETAVVEVLEEAARRLVRREASAGPIEHLHAYAWTAIRSVVVSRLRLGRERVVQMTDPRLNLEGRLVAPPLPAHLDIEANVLLSEAMRRLTPLERRVLRMRLAGFSTREIASRVGRSAATIDSQHSRSMAKLRAIVVGSHSRTPRKR